MTKRERLKLDRQYREGRLDWRREVEVLFDLKAAPALIFPDPGILDAADPELG